MADAGIAAIRLGVLAVSVLHNIDVRPADGGIVLTGSVPVDVSWAQCRQALAGSDPQTDEGRNRLSRWLRARSWIAERDAAELADSARPVGLPRDHTLHPGPGWVREHVLGDVLDLGLGIVGLDRRTPHDLIVVPPGVWAAADIDADPWWPAARAYLAAMSALAVTRWRQTPGAVLRPMGDCDVATLLASRPFRTEVARGYDGMASIAVPTRARGWTDLRAIDPAFAPVAAAATSPKERGFVGPLLVTSEEIVLVAGRQVPHYL